MDFLLYSNTSGLACIAVLVFLFHFMRKYKTGKFRMEAPEPPGSWPIIGHLPLLSGNEPLHIKLESMAYKYGPIFNLRLGRNPTLVVSSCEFAKELFTSKDLAVSSRAEMVGAKILTPSNFAFAPYGAYWRDMRKFVMTQLLSNRRLELLKHVRISEVHSAIAELYNNWKENRNEAGHVMIELKQWLNDLTLNVILRMIVGKKYFGDKNVAGNESKARRLQKAIKEFFMYLGIVVLRDAVPFLGWLDVGGHEKAMKKTAKELDSIVGEWLEEHKQKRLDASGVNGDQGDFMDVMLSVINDDSFTCYGADADTIIKATSLGMIAGGTDTSIVTMTWAISLLLNNPDKLKKVQEELDSCVGKNRLVNDEDISKLVYLQAIVKETFRLYPAGPLIAPRQFNDDCIVGGYHVSKGTLLIVNAWKIHRDPRVWKDPLEFKPERFLETNKNIDVKGLDFELLPFGSGRRQCPGILFGLQMVTFTLARFLQAFKIITPTNSPVDMSQSPGLTNGKATPLEVIVSPRLCSDLYM